MQQICYFVDAIKLANCSIVTKYAVTYMFVKYELLEKLNFSARCYG